jgi:TPR repeat protein
MRFLLLSLGIAINAHSAHISLDDRFKEAIGFLNKGSDRYNPEHARTILEQNAYHEHPASMARLSKLYMQGEGGPVNYEEAIKILGHLGELGYAIGYVELAKLYKKGIGVAEDEGKARDYIEKALILDPEIIKRHQHDEAAKNYQRIKNPLDEILQKARKERAQGSIDGAKNALLTYQEYISFADQHGFKKDPKALVEYARLLVHGAGHDGLMQAADYLLKAHNAGDEEATIELVKVKLKINTKASHQEAQAILFQLPNQEKTNRLLALSYLLFPFELNENGAPKVYQGLHTLHKEGNYNATAKLLIWSFTDKTAQKANLDQALVWLDILDKKGQHQAILDAARILEKSASYARAYTCLMKLVHPSVPHAIKSEAFVHLAYGLGQGHYTAPDNASRSLWLKEAFTRRHDNALPKLNERDLATVLCETAILCYKTDRRHIDTPLSLLDDAIALNYLNAARLKFDVLLSAERVPEAFSLLDMYIPRPQAENFQDMLYNGTLPQDKIDENLAEMALLACQNTTPDQPGGNSASYGHYLSYAGRSTKKRAFVSLGNCLLLGSLGFKKDQNLGFSYLNQVTPENKYFSNAKMAIGQFYLLNKDYDTAFSVYKELDLAKKQPRIEIITQLTEVYDKFDKENRYGQASALLELLLRIADRYNYHNEGVALARYNLAFFYYNKKPGVAIKEPREIEVLCDQSELPEGLIIKSYILLDQQRFKEALTTLESAKRRLDKNSDLTYSNLLLLGYTHAMLGNIGKASEFFRQTSDRGVFISFFNMAIIELSTDQKALKNLMQVFGQKKELYEKIIIDRTILNPFFFVKLKKSTHAQLATKIKNAVTTQGSHTTTLVIKELIPLVTFSLQCLKRAEEDIKNLSDAQKIRDDIAQAQAILLPLSGDAGM